MRKIGKKISGWRTLNLKRDYANLGQTIAEYAILAAVAVFAIVAMEAYVKRTLQARYRGASRYLIDRMRDEGGATGAPYQYEPYYANSEFTVTRNSQSQSDFFGRIYAIDRSANEETKRTGAQILLPGPESAVGSGGGGDPVYTYD